MAEQAGGDGKGSRETVIPVVEETMRVSTRHVETDRVIVHKTVSTFDETIEGVLRTEELEVERVPVDRVVAEAPAIREEGDLLIIPVLEEQLVVQKRLVLKEEVRIRRVVRMQPSRQIIRLRREQVAAEHHSRSDRTGKEE